MSNLSKMIVVLLLSSSALANARDLPTTELALVDAIQAQPASKEDLIAMYGEPAKAEDVKVKSTNKVVASIWHYRNITKMEGTSETYPVTEFDIIDNKVVSVVFLGSDTLDQE